VVFERAACAQAASTARALAPDLIVLAGDAAHDRGAALISKLAQVPLLVICAPELGGLTPQTPPRHIGYLSPEGGVTECARRVRAVVGLFAEEGLATCSMQQFADTVSSRTPPTASASKAPPLPSKAPALPPRPSASQTLATPKAQTVASGPPPLRAAIARAAATSTQASPTLAAAAAPRAPAPTPGAPAAATAPIAPAVQPPTAAAMKPLVTTRAAAPNVAVAQPAAPAHPPSGDDDPSEVTTIAQRTIVNGLPTLTVARAAEPAVAVQPQPRSPAPQAVAAPQPQAVAAPQPQAVAAPQPQAVAAPRSKAEPVAQPELVVPISDRPTSPPGARISLTEVDVTLSEPAPPASRAEAEPEIDVSLSVPPPSAPEPVRSLQAAPPKLPRQHKAAPEATAEVVQPRQNKPAPAPVAEVVQPRQNRPAPAAPVAEVVQPLQIQAAPAAPVADVAQPRAARRVRNPLDAPAPWSASALADYNAASDAPATKSSRAPLFYGLAAVGCAALILLWMYGGSSDPSGGAAARGSLKPTASAPETLAPMANERAPSPYTTESPTTQPVVAATQAAVAPSLPTGTFRVGNTNPTDSTRSAASPAPVGAQALVDEGTALLKQGRLGLAESSYQKAMQATPDFPTAIVGLVRVHLARRDGAEAVRWAKLLVSKQPGGVSQLLLGDAQALYGDHEAATNAWTAAAKSGNALARQRLAQ
jgi:hypothetical protein